MSLNELITVAAVDEQGVAIDADRWCRLATAVLIDEGLNEPAELMLWFVDEDEIAELNEEHLGESGPTDVLSFPLDRPGEEPPIPDVPLLLGDVFVCPAVAARNAPDHPGTHLPIHQGSLEDELALLIVHGVLHILGYDHAEPDETEVMQARERTLLSQHYKAGTS